MEARDRDLRGMPKKGKRELEPGAPCLRVASFVKLKRVFWKKMEFGTFGFAWVFCPSMMTRFLAPMDYSGFRPFYRELLC